jgi:hypothetical protein
MDWKREAADKLRQYEAKCKACEKAGEKLRTLEAGIDRIRSTKADRTPIRGDISTYEDSLLNNIALRDELKFTIRLARMWLRQVDAALGVLDEQERLVLERFYIHSVKGNVERLCGELNREKSTVYDLRDKALRHFTIAMYGNAET